MKNVGWMFAGLCLIVAVGLTASAQDENRETKVKIVDNGECLAGLEILGKWKLKKDITEFVDGSIDGTYATNGIEFMKSDESRKRILEQSQLVVDQMLKSGKKPDEAAAVARAFAEIYAAGEFKFGEAGKETSWDFALVNFQGNPTLFFLRVTSNGKYDWESSNIAFVRHPEGDNDLLFIGGDHKNEEFTAFQRAK